MNESFSEIYRQVTENRANENRKQQRPIMALVVVDAQNDFTEDGPLEVPGASDAYRKTYAYMAGSASKYSVIATTKNIIDPSAENPGAEIHPDLQRALDFFSVLNPHAIHIDVNDVTKGKHSLAHSIFEGKTEAGISLADALRASDVEEIDVIGVATDFCVRATVLDALNEGFSVRVLRNQIAGVSAEGSAKALAEMAERGATIV